MDRRVKIPWLFSEIRTIQLTISNYRLPIAFTIDRIRSHRYPRRGHDSPSSSCSRHRQFDANAYYHGHGRLTVKQTIRANDRYNSREIDVLPIITDDRGPHHDAL